eukprot:1176466-Prorocentrum_minimum.AAC.3
MGHTRVGCVGGGLMFCGYNRAHKGRPPWGVSSRAGPSLASDQASPAHPSAGGPPRSTSPPWHYASPLSPASPRTEARACCLSAAFRRFCGSCLRTGRLPLQRETLAFGKPGLWGVERFGYGPGVGLGLLCAEETDGRAGVRLHLGASKFQQETGCSLCRTASEGRALEFGSSFVSSQRKSLDASSSVKRALWAAWLMSGHYPCCGTNAHLIRFARVPCREQPMTVLLQLNVQLGFPNGDAEMLDLFEAV